jgi:hypothetical protein
MERYEIRVVGHLDTRRAHAFGCDGLERLPDGNTVLVVEAPDQAALYGLLARLRDAGLALVSVHRVLVIRAVPPGPTKPDPQKR